MGTDKARGLQSLRLASWGRNGPCTVGRIWLLQESQSTWKQLKTLLWKVPIFPKRILICPYPRSLVKLGWEGEIKVLSGIFLL